MFVKLNYNSKDNIYSIPTKKDGTTFQFEDTHPAVKHFAIIKPPATYRILPGYDEPIYCLIRAYDPFRTGVYAANSAYYIHTGETLAPNPPTSLNRIEQEEE